MKETHVKGYAITFAVLLGLAFVNMFVAEAGINGLNTAIIMTIACVQAFILLAFFMHLREAARFLWIVVFSGFFFVAVLAVYVVADSYGRETQVRPPQSWENPKSVTMPAAPVHAAK